MKWPLIVILGAATGCMPLGISGVPEFCAIIALPFYLGFLIGRWWTGSLMRIVLAVALPLLGSVVRLLVSSVHDGSNWFEWLSRMTAAVGFTNPYVWQVWLTLFVPVMVTATAMVACLLPQIIDRYSVTRLFVVIGDPSRSPFQKYKEPGYDTDPRRYGLKLLDQPVSDDQFNREYRPMVRAFVNRQDAISCACHCNLATVLCPVYDRVGNEWVYNEEETRRVAADIV